jgi:hypothetical protein
MRVILRRSPQGFRSPRGGHVIDLQRGLQQSGHSPQSIDGIFGGFTEAGVQSWQLAQGRQATGEVDELTWRGIVRTDPPALFRRCLALTAAFEGHGYTLALGNWDNAFITWGIVGFTLKGGNLGEVVRRIAARHPGLLERVIGDDRARALLDVIGATRARQQAFANAISLPPKKVRLQTDWEDAFEGLGNRPEVRAIQDEVARDRYWATALRDFRKFDLEDELDAALMFDTAVQNGGIDGAKEAAIRRGLAAAPGATGQSRREIFANAIAEESSPDFVEDVRSRRLTIARSQGKVHGAIYRVEDWGLAQLTADAIDLV